MQGTSAEHTKVFPTPVGVFPFVTRLMKILVSLPHARGGVSIIMLLIDDNMASSPRPWGCF